MAYDENAIEIAKLSNKELETLLNELLSKVTKTHIKIRAFSQPKWATKIGGAYPNAPLHDTLKPDEFFGKINRNHENSFWFRKSLIFILKQTT